MDRNFYRKTSITHEPDRYHYQQNSQSVPYSPAKVSHQQINRLDKFDQISQNNKPKTQKGQTQAQGRKMYSNYNNRESEDFMFYEKNSRNNNQRNDLPKSPKKPYLQKPDNIKAGYQNDDHYAMNFDNKRFGSQEEFDPQYMEPTREMNRKRPSIQNKANEGRYSSMNRLIEMRKKEFENDEYVYEGRGDYGSNQKENFEQYDDDDQQDQQEGYFENNWRQGYNQRAHNYDDEEDLTYEDLVQSNNNNMASYRSSADLKKSVNKSTLDERPPYYQAKNITSSPSHMPKQGILSNATSKKKLDLITLRSDYPEVPVFQLEDDFYNEDQSDDENVPQKSYSQIHSERLKKQNAKLAKQSFDSENKYAMMPTSNQNVKASPLNPKYDNQQQKKKGEGWNTERDMTFENNPYMVREYPPTVPRKNRWEKQDITNTKEKKYKHQHENVSPKYQQQQEQQEFENNHSQPGYWPMSSPMKKKQLQENTSKYLNTAHQSPVHQSYPNPNYKINTPSSAKKPVKKQNLWIEEPTASAAPIQNHSQSFHSSTQEAQSHYGGIPRSPPKRSISSANLIDDNSQDMTRSKNQMSTKPIARDSYSPAGARNTTQNAPEQMTISNQPPFNVSYVPTAATTPNSHVQLQLQLPIALNPMQPNFVNPAQQMQFNNLSYVYPNNFQMHPQNQAMAMNYPYTPNTPFYLNPQQMYQNPPHHMIYPNIPQPVYNNIHQNMNPQAPGSSNNSFMYYSNYGSIQQDQQSNLNKSTNYSAIYPPDQSSIMNNKLSQIIPSQSASEKTAETGESHRKTVDKSIKNYIKDQEELLKKLDDDKKKLAERLKNPVVENTTSSRREQKETTGEVLKREATPSKLDNQKSSKTSPKNIIKTPTKIPDAAEKEVKKPVQEVKETKARSVLGTPKNNQVAAEKDVSAKKERVSAWEAPPKQKSNKKEKKKPAEFSLMDNSMAQVKSLSPKSPNFKIPTPKASTPVQAEPEKEEQPNIAWKMDFTVSDSQKSPAVIVENVIQDFPNKKPTTLAEMFMKNKRDLAEKLVHQKDHSKHTDKADKPVRTKEEILKQRKAMMEYKGPARAKSQIEERNDLRKEDLSPAPARGFGNNPFLDPAKQVKEPNSELLNRLAFGTRAKVTKEEMKELNKKNYELLPEVRKKKEEEKKKEEMRKRLEKARELDEKIRGTMRRKTIKNFD